MTNREKWTLSIVILLMLALGLAPLEKIRTISLAGSSLLLALICLRLAAVAVVHWRRGRRISSAIWLLVALMVGLLCLVTLGKLVEKSDLPVAHVTVFDPTAILNTKRTPNMTPEEKIRHEIEELHRFFEGWFTGQLTKTPSVLARLTTALADEFEIIHPGGQVTSRDALLKVIEEAHASQAGSYEIWIDKIRVRKLGNDVYFAVYEEWQRIEGTARGRLSTALFRVQPETPLGVAWVHLQETWLPQS